MTLARTDVLNRIEEILSTHETPRFNVIVGEPLALTADAGPWVTFWYLGDAEPEEGIKTFGNVMVYERFHVQMWWRREIEYGTPLARLEEEIWEANRTVKAAFRGDSQLDGLCDDLEIVHTIDGTFGRFPETASQQLYRTIGFELRLKDLDAEAINA